MGWHTLLYPERMPRGPEREPLGRRIAEHRGKRGWTQTDLAERLGISRVALSHLETDVSPPGERTVALLAGLFKLAPLELVAGTTYPAAKADRLPLVANQYTEAEHQVSLCEADLAWIGRGASLYGDQRLAQWDVALRRLAQDCHRHDRDLVESCHQKVRHLLDERSAG